jgi:hypothetical protein
MSDLGTVYEFTFRGLLAEEALDQNGRSAKHLAGITDEAIAVKLSIDLLDGPTVEAAKRMATVYTAIAAFENMVRDLVSRTMLEEKGETWWDDCVSAPVRKRAKDRQEEEERHRFHTQRGDLPINFTELKDLLNIIRANWEQFEAFMPTPEWAQSIFDAVERSRNVIMHSGMLDAADIDRVGIHIRDWVKQVGT